MKDPTNRTREEMLADLDISDAEVEAGEIVPGEVVLESIQAAIDRLEARLARATPRKAAPRR
jgi:hypothetical protein